MKKFSDSKTRGDFSDTSAITCPFGLIFIILTQFGHERRENNEIASDKLSMTVKFLGG